MNIPPQRIRGGRPSSDVWDHVSREKGVNDGKIKQTCNYCGTSRKSFQCLASQWALHLVDRCPAVDVEISVEIFHSRRDTVKGVKEAGERRGLHLQDTSLVGPATPNTRHKTARNAVMKAEELGIPLGPTAPNKRKVDDNKSEDNRSLAADGFSIWDHVTKSPSVDGYVEQTCNYCGYTKKAVQLAATNWAVHLVDHCKAVDAAIAYQVWDQKKHTVRLVRHAGARRGFVEGIPPPPGSTRLLKSDPNSTTTTSLHATSFARAASLDGSTASAFRYNTIAQKKQRTSMYDAGDYCDQARADKITLAVMEFLAGCGTSMMVVESSFFINMLKTLNETYVKTYLPKADVFTRMWLPKLFDSVNEKLNSLWRVEKDSFLSLASDVFINDEGRKVLILTESKLWKVAFRKMIAEGEERLTDSVVAQMWMDRLVSTAGGDPTRVEATFGAVCADTTKINPSVGRTIEDKYPKVFFNGCRTRCVVSLCEQIASIPQIEMLIKNTRTIIEFVREHEPIKRAYARHMKQCNGSNLVSYLDIGFEHIHAMFESLLGPEEQNIELLNALVTDPEWSLLSSGISPWNVAEFVALVQNHECVNRVKCIRNITQPLSIFNHHLQRAGTRASWLLPAFGALEKDLFTWCDDATTAEYFSEETVATIKKTFQLCWKGLQEGERGSLTGLYAPQHFLAMLLDPTTTLNVEQLNQLHPMWYQECRKVLKRFYDENDLIMAKTQLYDLVNQTGTWGDEVSESQSYVAVAAEQHRFNVQTVAARQVKSVDLKPHLLWKVSIGGQFPKLKDIALRLLTMSTECTDVERVCEVPKFVNSKVCNRLKNDSVAKLIYCYINLRLLKNAGVDNDASNVVEDFLCDSILEEDDADEFGGASANSEPDGIAKNGDLEVV